MLTADEIAGMRSTSVSALPDECTISRAPIDEQATFDEITGDLDPPASVTVYQGACRVRPRDAQEQDDQIGDLPATLGRYVCTLPHTADVAVDDFVTVTATTDDLLAGRSLRVVHVGWSSYQVDRRVGLEDRERPAGAVSGS